MNYANKRLQLATRNEGKIKSYGSCIDVRAWSHDLQTRDHYLRDWMKSDMPICVIPVKTIIGFLDNMTRRNHAKEELETSHWPCDRCLDALKSIKMFWRIILNKIFRVNIETNDSFTNSNMCSSVRSVAKHYLDEISEQTIFLRKIIEEKAYDRDNHKADTIRFKIYSNDFVILTPKESKHKIIFEDKAMETEKSLPKEHPCRKTISQGVSVTYKTVDFGCETCNLEHEGISEYKQKVDHLQRRLDLQNIELGKLTKENVSMKLDLQQIYRSNHWSTSYRHRPNCAPFDEALERVPAPFESCEEEDNLLPKTIDSEMIITLKNCKNETYTNISLLQVIHKSNASELQEMKGPGCKQDDPIRLLTKVQDTFGSIVQREIGKVNENQRANKNITIINSSYVNGKTARSGSTMSLHSISSETVFVSTSD
ncbi:unnamed protein product [Leptosia nina]|uniref:Uncharacterized protein n=1 Tax=Leptosia nina TaxID=320188 RepID=A0AAV1JJJ7_9NEOP